jgi:hypothetical protein
MLLFGVISAVNAESKFIGPEGGKIDAGHGCTLVIQPDAVGSEEKFIAAGKEAIELFLDLNDYINSLEVISDGKSTPDDDKEWIRKSFKNAIYDKLAQLKSTIKEAKEHFAQGDYQATYQDIAAVLKGLEKAEEKMKQAESQGKISPSAAEEILDLMAEAWMELFCAREALGVSISAEASWTEIEGDKILEFAFGPHGLVFPDDLPAMLIIPLSLFDDEELDGKVYYSPDGDSIEPFELDYEIDDKNVILYIPGFSYYYYPRR